MPRPRVFTGWEVAVLAATLAAGVLHAAAAPAHFPTATAPAAHALGHPKPPPTTRTPAEPEATRAAPAVERGRWWASRPEPAGPAVPAGPTPTTPDPGGGLLGWLFLAAAAFAGWVVWQLALTPAARPLLALVGVGHLSMVAAGITSRTVGLLGHRDPWWELAFLLALTAEAVVVAGCVALTRRREPASRHRPWVPPAPERG